MSATTPAPNLPSGLLRWWHNRDRPGWRSFGVAMVTLAGALLLALYSAAVAQQGRALTAGIAAVGALLLSAWVAIAIVPVLARRSSLRWLLYQIDYRLTKEGLIYIGLVFVVILAAVNTGNNLLFLIIACLLAGMLISGVLSRVVLTGVELRLELPERIFAQQPLLATLELANEKEVLPSFSLRVTGEDSKTPAQILSRPVFFPYIPQRSSMRQKVELVFPRRGVYRQDAFAIRTKFPFGLFEKTRRVPSPLEVVVYPHVEPAEQFYEILPLLSGEMETYFRGRGHDLYALRDYLPTDSARFVDWKVSAKTGGLKVREFTREDERRLMLVFDPYQRQPDAADVTPDSAGKVGERFERAVSLAASIAWHFHGINSVIQFRTDRQVTPMAPATELIYDILRELAFLEPREGIAGDSFLDPLATEGDVFKIILTNRAQHTIPSALWSSSYFIFIDSL
jgi:uncharacterized protein (DUF58 family)